MTRIVVVGKRSSLARRFLATSAFRGDCVAVTHDEEAPLDGAQVVVNFAFHPRLRSEPYDSDLDVDLALAKRLPTETRFVMLSSRMVYGSYACGATERSAVAGPDARGLNRYGTNKLEIERRLRDLLGDRLTVLRISNPLGYHPGSPRFMSRLLDSLRGSGRISLDVSPFTRRDFVTEQYLVEAIEYACLCMIPLTGTFNLGSGIGTEVGRIALWAIDGLGRGELVITDPHVRDEFWLDMSRAAPLFGPPPSHDELRAVCVGLGRSLTP